MDESIIARVELFCYDETKDYPDESHNLDHHRAVDWNTRIIAGSEGITEPMQIVALRVAALVHDIVDYKYCAPHLQGMPTIEEKRARLEQFLNSITELCGWVPRILLWIDNMSFSKEKKHGLPKLSSDDMKYRNILSDADKWEALGPIGIQRCKEYHMMLTPGIDEANLNREIMTHMEEKIMILHQYCRTELGKQHAIELTKPIREWYAKQTNRLADELKSETHQGNLVFWERYYERT